MKKTDLCVQSGITPKELNRLLKKIKNPKYNSPRIFAKWKGTQIDCDTHIPPDLANAIINHFNNPPSTRKLFSKGQERQIQSSLQQQLGGIIDSEIEGGRIDLLTEKEIIEVKKIASWKEALGQILVYGYYYPEKIKRIHLFYKTEFTKTDVIESHCQRLGIAVTYEVR